MSGLIDYFEGDNKNCIICFTLLQGKKERLYLQSLFRKGLQKDCSLKSVESIE